MNDIVSAVKNLHLPTGKYCVVGGGALAARGLRIYNDVDLIVTPDLYQELKIRHNTQKSGYDLALPRLH